MSFDLLSMIFVLVFIAVIISILSQAIGSFTEWSTNNSSPILTKQATLVAKRVETKISRHTNNNYVRSRNIYFLTFESSDTGNRRTFKVNRNIYDQLIENDQGNLTFQGTRYHHFVRVAG